MKLLVIDGVDLTSYIPMGEYEVNKTLVYNEWVDGNYKHHRDVVRTQIKGTIKLHHHSLEQYEEFVSLITKSRLSSGYIPVQIYCNNTMTVEHTKVFFDWSPENMLPYIGSDKYEGFTITLEEE